MEQSLPNNVLTILYTTCGNWLFSGFELATNNWSTAGFYIYVSR